MQCATGISTSPIHHFNFFFFKKSSVITSYFGTDISSRQCIKVPFRELITVSKTHGIAEGTMIIVTHCRKHFISNMLLSAVDFFFFICVNFFVDESSIENDSLYSENTEIIYIHFSFIFFLFFNIFLRKYYMQNYIFVLIRCWRFGLQSSLIICVYSWYFIAWLYQIIHWIW